MFYRLFTFAVQNNIQGIYSFFKEVIVALLTDFFHIFHDTSADG